MACKRLLPPYPTLRKCPSTMRFKPLKTIGELSLIGLLTISVCALPFKGVMAAENDPPQAQSPAAPAASGKTGKENMSFGDYLAGRFAESQGDSHNGLQFLRDSYKRDPNNKDVAKNLYRMLLRTGDIQEAIPLAKNLQGVKVVEDGKEFTPEMLLAVSEAKEGKFAEADKHLAAIQLNGFNALLVPQLRAWISFAQGGMKTPVDIKAMTPEGHVVLPHVYLNAALIDDAAGFDKDAQKNYETAVKDTRIEPFRAVEALANFYGRKGMKDKRDKLVKDYLADHGDSYIADELLVAEPQNAAPLVSNAKDGLAEVFFTLANIFHGVRAPADEVATLHLALYLRSDYPAAQFLLAAAYELAQDFQSATDTYKAINPKSPYFARGRIRSAYDQIALNKKDEAVATLDAIIHDQPTDTDALLAKGDILRADNKFKEAIEAYDMAAKRVPNPQKRHWIIYFSRGATYQQNGDWPKAEADMKKALELSPTEPAALNYLGYSWLTMNQHIPEAKKMVEQAYEARPEDASIIDSMGYALYMTGDFAGAEEYFDQALERTPNDPTVNDHLGDAYWQLGRKTEARYQWERALTNKPDAEAEKNLHKKLKDGIAMLPASLKKTDTDKKPSKPLASKETPAAQ